MAASISLRSAAPPGCLDWQPLAQARTVTKVRESLGKVINEMIRRQAGYSWEELEELESIWPAHVINLQYPHNKYIQKLFSRLQKISESFPNRLSSDEDN